ncbi:hypothetical protein, partial [uncultured Kosakonia sp.]|uniref:hypothetical protein n=1 Tax=uncultured Kosakonia sp. TaxID=1588927 RepID=UPI002597AC49
PAMSTVPENCLMALRLSGYKTVLTRRPDKAVRRHPAMSTAAENCLMALRLSGLQPPSKP